MSLVGKTLVGLTVATLFVTGPAFGSPEVDEEIAEMRRLVEDLKDRVEAQEEQIEHQGTQLEEAQRVVRTQQDLEDGALSGVSEFWGAIDVNLSAAGSYAYNFANPDVRNALGGTGATGGGAAFPGTGPAVAGVVQDIIPGSGVNGGALGLYPFHGDHNSFQVDQVWLDIGKTATEESRGGFMFTALFGNTATWLGQGSSSFGRNGGVLAAAGVQPGGDDSASDIYVHQAYVSYLAPIGPEGFEVTAGKFATIIGAEVADASANWNVTRGNVYQLFQPIDHTGVLGSTSFGPVTLKGGVVNGGNLSNGSPDFNKEKSYLGSIGVGNDMVGLAVNVLYGAEGGRGIHPAVAGTHPGDNAHREGLVDVVATLTTDGFEAWVNADYLWAEESSAAAYGVAVAGMVPLTDLLSVAARLEYARDDGRAPIFGFAVPGRHSDVYSATGTIAYELAENLTLKGEVRYDKVNEGPATPDAFVTNTTGGSSSQVVGLGQMIYAF